MTLQRQHIPVLGVDATPLDVAGLTEVLDRFVADGTTRTVVGHNLHSVTLFHSEPEFRKFYENSDVVLIDGAPVLWLWGRPDERAPGPSWTTGWVRRTGFPRWARSAASSDRRPRGRRRGQRQGRGEAAGHCSRRHVAGMPGEGWDEDVEETAAALAGGAAAAAGADRPGHAAAGRGAAAPPRRRCRPRSTAPWAEPSSRLPESRSWRRAGLAGSAWSGRGGCCCTAARGVPRVRRAVGAAGAPGPAPAARAGLAAAGAAYARTSGPSAGRIPCRGVPWRTP